ncbi:MAG: hypothetical protein ABI678_08045 [Kofleriaceae bacterium]
MGYRCGNCGGFYTQAEATRLKPPMHPWPITASGQRTMTELPLRGIVLSVCPGCGQPTLHAR